MKKYNCIFAKHFYLTCSSNIYVYIYTMILDKQSIIIVKKAVSILHDESNYYSFLCLIIMFLVYNCNNISIVKKKLNIN